MLSTNQGQQRQMGGGRKPQGKGLTSQFHWRQWRTCAWYCRHCSLTQLTRKRHHILPQRYWSWAAGPRAILTDEEVSLAISSFERGPPVWPRRLPVASFKQDKEKHARISTNHTVTFWRCLVDSANQTPQCKFFPFKLYCSTGGEMRYRRCSDKGVL